MTLETIILDELKRLDELHEKLQPEQTGASPHPPQPKWLPEVQKRNPFYQEIFGNQP